MNLKQVTCGQQVKNRAWNRLYKLVCCCQITFACSKQI